MPDLKKTALCEDFKNGKCLLPSSECTYAHGEHELRKGQAFHSIRKETAELSPRSDSSSNGQPVQSTLQGGQVPQLPATDQRDPNPSLQYPQHEKTTVGQSLRNPQPLQNQQQQALRGMGAREDARFWVSGCQQFPSTQGSELQLQVLLRSLRQLMEANPGLASRLAPPGLPLPSTGTAAAVTPMLMSEKALMGGDFSEPKSKLLGTRMYDDDPWHVPVPRCGPFSYLSSEHQSVWQL